MCVTNLKASREINTFIYLLYINNELEGEER